MSHHTNQSKENPIQLPLINAGRIQKPVFTILVLLFVFTNPAFAATELNAISCVSLGGTWSIIETKCTISSTGTIFNDIQINTGTTFYITTDASVTINSGITITNYGTITNFGTIINSGTIIAKSGTINSNYDYEIIENVGTITSTNYGRISNAGTIKYIGGSAILILTFPENLPEDTTYWKFGPTKDNINNHWYQIDSIVNGDTLSFTLKDGEDGDDDLIKNGEITDDRFPSVSGTSDPNNSIPEFPTVMLPIISVIFLVFLFKRRMDI